MLNKHNMPRFDMCLEFYKKISTHPHVLLQLSTYFRSTDHKFAHLKKLPRLKVNSDLTSLCHLLYRNHRDPYQSFPPPFRIVKLLT